MIIHSLHWPSERLSGDVSCTLLLPEKGTGRLLTLLHGAGEGPEDMLRNCDLSALAEALGLAVLLPELGNTFYLDWGEGRCARSCLTEELLPAVRADFGLSARREDNVVGGISMGGFGALSLALDGAGRFAGAFSLSGALDLSRAAQLCRICALPPPGDLRAAAQRPEARLDERLSDLAARGGSCPLYLAWGDRDWFLAANRAFADHARSLSLPLTAQERPGQHDWTFWKQALPKALTWSVSI